MEVEINDKIKQIINEMPFNTTVKRNAVKIYGALYLLSIRKNKFGYFPVASEYLKSINLRYYKIIDYFEEAGLITPYTRLIQDDKDIFNDKKVKYYDVKKGICMKYKFNIPTTGYMINVDLITNKFFRWYNIIQDSLLEAGYEDVKISRDSFGRRVHHSAIRDYKKDFQGYYTIDAKCSQPRLLWLDMKKNGVIDFPVHESSVQILSQFFYAQTFLLCRLSERRISKSFQGYVL